MTINVGNINTPASAAQLAQLRRDLGLPTIVSQSGIAISHTGTTAATQILSLTIPGGSMGPNGGAHLWIRTSETNNANNKTLIIRLSGTAFFQAGDSSKPGREYDFRIQNRGAVGSQTLGWTGTGNTVGAISSAGVPVVSSFNSDADQSMQVLVTLANAADSFGIEAYRLVTFYGA